MAAVAAVGYYSACAAWEWTLFERSGYSIGPLRLFLHPVYVWHVVLLFNKHGTWSLESGEPISGVFLWIIWAIEAVFIFFFAGSAAKIVLRSEPFCESCGVWCGKPKRLGTLPMRDVKELRRQLESAEFGAVAPLSPNPPPGNQWLSFWHHTCPRCGQLNTLSAKKTAIVQNQRSKKTRIENRTLIDKLLLHPGEAELFIPPPPSEPPPAPAAA